jgi:hypothetical protein
MLRLASLLFGIVGTTLAGIAVILVVSVPAWSDDGMLLLPITTIGAFVLAAPLSWLVAHNILSQKKPRQSSAY